MFSRPHTRHLLAIVIVLTMGAIFRHVLVKDSSENETIIVIPEHLSDPERIKSGKSLPFLNCTAGIPCVYEEEVDLRIIVITHDRKVSVMKLLESLQGLELDGDRAVLEIWIDPKQDGTVHKETLEAVSNFTWLKGPTRVHVQTAHVGIMGQWIDTWRPKNAPPFQKDPKAVEDSPFISSYYKEIGLILEDDLNVSTQAYRWLKAVHGKYNGRPDYAGATLQSDEVLAHNTGARLAGFSSNF